MAAKIVFTCEEVVNAAYKLAEENGINSISARKVAEKMKSSTAPVYSCFKSMDDLKHKVQSKIKDEIIKYATVEYSSKKKFLNIGIGIVLFAKERKNLFRAIFLEGLDSKEAYSGFMEALNNEMEKNENFKVLSKEEKKELLEKMIIFTLGLATLISEKMIGEDSDNYIKTIIEKVSDIFAKSAFEDIINFDKKN